MTLTVGTTGANGTINFSPGSVELVDQLSLVTHVDVNWSVVSQLNAVGNTGRITKLGAATLNLSGANSYGGPTNVNAGTLLATNSIGSATSSGPVSVNIAARSAVREYSAARQRSTAAAGSRALMSAASARSRCRIM